MEYTAKTFFDRRGSRFLKVLPDYIIMDESKILFRLSRAALNSSFDGMIEPGRSTEIRTIRVGRTIIEDKRPQ